MVSIESFLDGNFGERSVSKYEEGEEIYVAGEVPQHVYFVANGQVKLSRVTTHGVHFSIGTAMIGDFFGLEALESGETKRAETATALVPSDIRCVSRSLFLGLISEDSEFAKTFAAYMAKRSHKRDDDVENLMVNSTEKRLARELLRLSHFGTPHVARITVTQATLAELVGATRQTVSQTLSLFRKKRLITYVAKGQIEVHEALLDQVLAEKPNMASLPKRRIG